MIIPEQTYKVETLKHEKKKHLYDFLARNIIQNAALEESCWNKKLYNYLEDIKKMQIVENTKVCSIFLAKHFIAFFLLEFLILIFFFICF